MGSLALPAAGLVYLDASVLIYSVERVEPYRTLLEPMWRQAQDGELAIVSSPIVVIETLVKPLQDGNIAIELQYRELFEFGAVRLLDVPSIVDQIDRALAQHYSFTMRGWTSSSTTTSRTARGGRRSGLPEGRTGVMGPLTLEYTNRTRL